MSGAVLVLDALKASEAGLVAFELRQVRREIVQHHRHRGAKVVQLRDVPTPQSHVAHGKRRDASLVENCQYFPYTSNPACSRLSSAQDGFVGMCFITHLDPADLVLHKVDQEVLRDFSTSLFHAL